eukprot:s4082_g3.t3
MSPEPAEEPGSERGAPSDGGALHSGQDQRSESQEGSIGGRPNGQVSTQQNAGGQEESSSNMSRVTDQVIEPDHEVESPEFVSFEGEILDTNVETKVWLVRKDDSRMLLATYTGWRTRLLDPFDLPQARGYALTDRRQAFCIFPREESRVVNDRWPINIGRNMEKPWHGNVTFYESKEAYDPYQLFGQVTSARRLPGTTPANERLGGSSAPSSSSRPTGGHRGNGGNGGTHTHQHGGPAESLQKNGAAQLALEFPMDATDDDGQWHEINDVEMNDVPDDRMVRHVNMAVESQSRGEGSKVGEVFQLSSLRNCLRRRPSSTRSPFYQLMSWTIATAAQTFLQRLRSAHGAQEEPEKRRCEQHPVVYLCHDERRGQGRPDIPKDGNAEVREGMESPGDGAGSPDADDPSANGAGLHAEEGHGARSGGDRERWGEVQEADQSQGQGDSRRMDPSGHWQAAETIRGSEVLGEGAQGVSASCRVSALQSKQVRPMVGLPDMRIAMGEVRHRPLDIVDDHKDPRSSKLPEPENCDGHLSAIPARSKVQAGPRSCDAQGGQQGQDRYGSWRHWVNYITEVDHPNSRDGQGSIFMQGAQDDRIACSPTGEASSPLHAGPRGHPGECGGCPRADRSAHVERRGQGRVERRWKPSSRTTARRLVHQSQLGGECGKALGSLLKTHFSKFMVFLCMNCCLAPTTVSAFGSPDLVAWHHDNEFTIGKIEDGFTEPMESSGNYMACYVYGRLAQHFASAQADGHGKHHQLSKDLNGRLVKSLRGNPKILEVYSPPRVTQKAEKFGFTAGGALDLSTGWDFCKPAVPSEGSSEVDQRAQASFGDSISTLHYVLSTTTSEQLQARSCDSCP